jgi:hypothetical protein
LYRAYQWVGDEWGGFCAKWREFSKQGLRLLDIEAFGSLSTFYQVDALRYHKKVQKNCREIFSLRDEEKFYPLVSGANERI